MPHRLRRFLIGTAALLLIAAAYAPSIIQHRTNGRQVCNDDVYMHLPPYLRDISDPVRDYPERYIRACHPIGFRLLYTLAQRHDAVIPLSRDLPYVLTGVFVLLIAWAAYPLGGWTMAVMAAFLALSADIFLERAVGGLPRAFGFPLLAALLAALTNRRPFLLAACSALATLFYPTAAVIGGALLAAGLLVPRLQLFPLQAGTPLRRRIGMVAATALLCLAGLLPTLASSRPYAPRLAPADVEAYPEAGRLGRCNPEDRVDYDASLGAVLRQYAPLAIRNGGRGFMPTWHGRTANTHHRNGTYLPLLLLALLGLGWLTVCVPAGRGVAVYLAVSLVCYILAGRLAPLLFLPQRYVAYPLPLLTLILLPAGAAAAGYLTCPKQRPRAAAVSCVAGTGLLLLLFGGLINPQTGYNLRFRHFPVYDFLNEQRDAVIAGCPDWLAPVAFLCRRPVLVSQETHLPYHRGYADEMRARMAAQIDAFYSPTPQALNTLTARYGVTHLLVPHPFMRENYRGYFQPFASWFARASASFDSHPPYVMTHGPELTVYRDKHVAVLDLRRLTASPTPVPVPDPPAEAAAHAPAAADADTRPGAATVYP